MASIDDSAVADIYAGNLTQFTDLPVIFKSEPLSFYPLAPDVYWTHNTIIRNQPLTTNFTTAALTAANMSSFTSSPQRSKSTSAEHSVEVHGTDVNSNVPNGNVAVNSGNHNVISSSDAASARKKRTMTTSRRKREEQKLKQQELAEEPPDDYTRTTVEKMRSLMQATQPKLPITKVIELVGIPTNKFYEYRKRYLPGVYRTASSKKHRMNSEEEQAAVKKIRALIQESPHATMQEIIKRVGLPTTKFYDLRRRFLSHMFDGTSKRKTPNTTASKPEQKHKPALAQKSSSSANHRNDEDDDEDQDESDESSEPSEPEENAAATVAAALSSSNFISTSAGNNNFNNFNYTSNNATADTITAAGLIMSHLQQPTTSTTSFISCLQPQNNTIVSNAAANFVTSFTGAADMSGRIKLEPFVKVEPFVGALTLPANMQMPTSMNAATLPFMNADQFGNLTAMHTMPTTIDFGQQQQQQLQQQQQQLQQQLQQQQQQVVNMHPYWAYTTSTMLPDK